MNRRGFLAAFGAAMVAPDPDKLLWRPGARLISIPAAPVKKYKLFYEYVDGYGYASKLYFCESEALPEKEAIAFARQKRHYHLTNGASVFQIRAREYTGPSKFESMSSMFALTPLVSQRHVPWKEVKID